MFSMQVDLAASQLARCQLLNAADITQELLQLRIGSLISQMKQYTGNNVFEVCKVLTLASLFIYCISSLPQCILIKLRLFKHECLIEFLSFELQEHSFFLINFFGQNLTTYAYWQRCSKINFHAKLLLIKKSVIAASRETWHMTRNANIDFLTSGNLLLKFMPLALWPLSLKLLIKSSMLVTCYYYIVFLYILVICFK